MTVLISLDELAKQLQIHVNNAVDNNLDSSRMDIDIEQIHKLSQAQKLVEEVWQVLGNKSEIIRLDWEVFVKTGIKQPHQGE